MTKGLFKSIKETFTSMQMKAKLTSQNHNLDTKYRLYRKLLICITFVSNVASNFAGKMKVFRLTGYQELQAKPNLLDPHASPSFYKTSFTNWSTIYQLAQYYIYKKYRWKWGENRGIIDYFRVSLYVWDLTKNSDLDVVINSFLSFWYYN